MLLVVVEVDVDVDEVELLVVRRGVSRRSRVERDGLGQRGFSSCAVITTAPKPTAAATTKTKTSLDVRMMVASVRAVDDDFVRRP